VFALIPNSHFIPIPSFMDSLSDRKGKSGKRWRRARSFSKATKRIDLSLSLSLSLSRARAYVYTRSNTTGLAEKRDARGTGEEEGDRRG